MTPPDHVGDDPVPHAGGGSQGLSTARLTGLLNGTYAQRPGGTSSPAAPLPFFNVRDFGAKGDGSADDTAAIQAAINAATGGGSVYIPKGTHIVSSTLTINSSIALVGAHKRSSIIKLANGANCDIITVGTSVAEAEFRTFTIDGNKANNTSGRGIVFTAAGVYSGSAAFYFVTVNNCASHNIHAETFRSSGYAVHLIAGGSGVGDGIRIDGYDWILDSCNFGTNAIAGIRLNGGNPQIANTTCYGNQNNVYIDNSCDRATLSNMVLESSTQDNVLVNTTQQAKTIIINGSFGSPGTSNPGTYAHFKLTSCTSITVSGRVYDTTGQTTPVQPAYIFENNSASGCLIEVGGLQWKSGDYATAFCSNNVLNVTGIVNRIVLGPGALTNITGGTAANVGGIFPAWSLPTNANSSVAVNLGHLPRKWKTYDVYVRGVNLSAATGTVAVRAVTTSRSNGDDLTAGSTTWGVQSITAAAQNVRQDVLLASQITVSTTAEHLVRVDRRGVTGADGDTLAGAWGIEAVEVRWRA